MIMVKKSHLNVGGNCSAGEDDTFNHSSSNVSTIEAQMHDVQLACVSSDWQAQAHQCHSVQLGSFVDRVELRWIE